MRIPWPWRKSRDPAQLMAPDAASLGKPGFAAEALPEMEAVYRFALRLARGDEQFAQDVVQETFIRAYRSWDSYARGTNCRSWLFTICRREFLRLREREGRHPSDQIEPERGSSDAITDVAMTAHPEQLFFQNLVDSAVLAALDALPDEFRVAVVLSDLQGLSYPEVSGILGVPLGTVKSRLYRGRRILHEKLYDYAVESGYIKPGAVS